MKKNIVIVGLCLAALFLWSRSCGLSSAYKDMRSAYNEREKIIAADKQISDARIAELTNTIGQADNIIGQKERVIAEKSVLISRLSNQLDELIANEPVQPELESQPLVINLRGQVSKLTEMFSLAQKTIADKDEIIFQLGVPELVGIVDGKKIFKYPVGSVTWALNEKFIEKDKEYNNERALRLSCENLLTINENRGIIFKVFGIKIDLVRDVLVPGGTFALGYMAGK